ncbi:unnamed protein product [Brachionus calyciflorus]|uniref:Spindle assembly abnormal protein 6 homolog n=1 Tax=Brachionus calyciflorus TaxID=104777 RepID=A0A814D816_9BILA|nr:unnamed protein product [Brachionus calyciflorus]
MSTLGNLYSKNILVRLTNSKSNDDKFKQIHITVDYQITGTLQSHKTELIIKLTDESDPFFLYSLYMTEEDFQTLKHQQGLLVDFGSFGQRFIDLLHACDKDVNSDNPKFQLQLFTKDPLPFDHTNASLNIIEINPFKHLVHLSLSFMPGNDSDVKKYLATCLKTLKDEYNKLSKLFDETKLQLNQKMDNTQQLLSQKNHECDKLRVELDSQSERLMAKHMQELSFERDKSVQNQFSLQQKFEKEKKDLENNLMKTIKQLEQRLNDLEMTNKDSYEKKFKFEAQIQEMTIKNTTLLDEYNSIKMELNTIRKENSNLDSEMHTNEKLLNQLRSRNSSLEQEIKEKRDQIEKTQDFYNQEQENRKKLEETLKEKVQELKKKQGEINHYVEEFKKGNDVVTKLQDREKNLVNQIKLKTRILTEQEKVVKEKEKELNDLKNQFKEINLKLDEMSSENKELKASVTKKTSELEEAAKLLKRDENIISWLNKQLTENNITSGTGIGGGGGVGVSSGLMKTSQGFESNQFRPYGTINSTNNNLISCSVSSMGGDKTKTTGFYASRGVSGSMENEMDSLPLTLRQVDLNKSASNSVSAKLDPKYFQSSHSPQALTNNLDSYNNDNTLTTAYKMSNIKTGQYGGKSNEMDQQQNGMNGRMTSKFTNVQFSNGQEQTLQQTNTAANSNGLKNNPSLASAYFPIN